MRRTRQLREAYEEFIKNISLVIPVIKVNWSDFRSADVRDKPAHPPRHGPYGLGVFVAVVVVPPHSLHVTVTTST